MVKTRVGYGCQVPDWALGCWSLLGRLQQGQSQVSAAGLMRVTLSSQMLCCG